MSKTESNSKNSQRLQEQLRKRQLEYENNPKHKEKKVLYSITPAEQPDLIWPDFMDL